MKHLKKFFVNSHNITRDSYLWNVMSATLFAVQSAILLMVINRTNGIEDSGVFSIAYAVASLMYYIGEYGVRKYQVSDINEELSFTDYHSHRVTACLIAVLASMAYVLNGLARQGYSLYKAYIVFAICIIKVVEAYSEVYFGRYQQVGRLDVAAKTNFFRILAGLVACIAALITTGDMVVAMSIWLAVSIIAVLLSSVLVYKDFGTLEFRFGWKKILRIFRECFPIFAGYFLLLYVGNAPKYAIDACMNDTDQAMYNFIFMPVFAIGMFANFIFNPILVDLAHKWDEQKIREFTLMVLRQMAVIAVITLLAIGVALTFGAPVLGLLFGADLADYRIDLAILMVGGGMLAFVNFFAVVVTVMRYQKHLTAGYAVMAVAAWLLSTGAVQKYGIRGAAILYTVLMTAQTVIFLSLTFYFIRKEQRDIGTKRTLDEC